MSGLGNSRGVGSGRLRAWLVVGIAAVGLVSLACSPNPTDPPGDKTPPVLTLPDDMTVGATSPTGATVEFSATALDDVDGDVTVVCDPASGDTFAVGDSLVTCSATDAAGNASTGTFTVSVRDAALKVAAGQSHACVLMAQGTVSCWGETSGQAVDQLRVAAASASSAVTAGSPDPGAPKPVEGLASAVDVSTGASHSCAVETAGTVKCWGSNGKGQLGDGTTTDSTSPVKVRDIETAVSVSAGGDHTCAVLSDGTARCWGAGSDGELGQGTSTDSSTPVQPTVPGSVSVSKIATGSNHTCAVLNDASPESSLSCWGANDTGQLGNGGFVSSNIPVAVGGISDVADVAAGSKHTCASTQETASSQAVYCWGDNSAGQLGTGVVGSPVPTPVASNASTSTKFDKVAAGGSTTCVSTTATTENAELSCWGDNSKGQLGTGTAGTATPDPTPVPTVNDGSKLGPTVGGDFACTTKSGPKAKGAVSCWGSNDNGQLGTGPTDTISGPTDVPTLEGAPNDDPPPTLNLPDDINVTATSPEGAIVTYTATASDVGDPSIPVTCDPASGSLFPLGVTTVACFATDTGGNVSVGSFYVNVEVATSNAGYGVATGGYHSCAVIVSGAVRCWGMNLNGQLGVGNTLAYQTPQRVTGLGPTSVVTAGERHTCALGTDATVWCWGSNSYGQLGDGTSTSQSSPVEVLTGSSGITSVEAGLNFTCAVNTIRKVLCWGDNSSGQLGDGTTTSRATPVDVAGLGMAESVSAGVTHACAVRTDHTIRCWGDNTSGQLGDGTTSPSFVAPVQVHGITNAVAVSAGQNHTCALLADDSVTCWGDNTFGELGDNTTNSSLVPVVISGAQLVHPDSISAGQNYTCATTRDGGTYCWGANSLGQLGNGSNEAVSVPTLVSGMETGAAIATGYVHTCALRFDKSVACWGNNGAYQLGNGTNTSSLVPVTVSGIGDF